MIKETMDCEQFTLCMVVAVSTVVVAEKACSRDWGGVRGENIGRTQCRIWAVAAMVSDLQ
jgi:hypothetical protein